MDELNKITEALTNLTNNSKLKIIQMKYDEKRFRNIWIKLKLSKEIEVLFIRDKGDFWCEIGRKQEFFLLEDVFHVIGIKNIKKSQSFIEMIRLTSIIIIKHSARIEDVFNDTNFKATQKVVSEYASNRMLGKFNF